MATIDNNVAGPTGVQVFELTMDNPENQDELNRRLQKPGEPRNSPSSMLGRQVNDPSITNCAEKNGHTNDSQGIQT